jgi:hypothetical protein
MAATDARRISMSDAPEEEPIEPPAPQPAGRRPLRMSQILVVRVRILREAGRLMLLLLALIRSPSVRTRPRFTVESSFRLADGIRETKRPDFPASWTMDPWLL